MSAPCIVSMDRHLQSARPESAEGRLIVSQLGRGETPINSKAVSVRFVLEGQENYLLPNGKLQVVNAGQIFVSNGAFPTRCVVRSPDRTTGVCVYLPILAHDCEPNGEPPGRLDILGGEHHLFGAPGTAIGALLTRFATLLVHGRSFSPARAASTKAETEEAQTAEACASIMRAPLKAYCGAGTDWLQ